MTMRICVFCGASAGARESYAAAARALGRAIAAHGYGLVYGGGRAGLMGIVANAALAAGGEVIGIMPQALVDRELAHTGLTSLHIVESMHERKARMAEMSQAFVALPGGVGTLEEWFEMFSWAQLGLHRKALGLLNADGYFDALLAFLDHATEQGFVRRMDRDLMQTHTDPNELLALLASYVPTHVPRWLERSET